MSASIGEPIEIAIWLTGEEPDGMLRQWRADAAHMMARSRGLPVLRLSPLAFEVKRPGQDRVPPVPDHISGPDVRLLVATATVIGFETVQSATAFSRDLDKADLLKLRQITRRAHRRAGGGRLSDAETDAIIDQIGPTSAMRALRGEPGRTLH